MAESLRHIRVVAGWVIVGYVGLMLMVRLLEWVVHTGRVGPADGFLLVYSPSISEIMLLAAAVVITGVVTPASIGARPVALIAFAELGVLLCWSMIFGALSFVRWLTNVPDVLFGAQPPPQTFNLRGIVMVAGMAVLTAVASFFAWRVYVALDPLANDIAEIADQLADLDEEEAEEVAVAIAEPAIPHHRP